MPIKPNLFVFASSAFVAVLAGCTATQDMSDMTTEDLIRSGQSLITSNMEKQAEINAQQRAETEMARQSGQQVAPQDILNTGLSVFQSVTATMQNEDAHVSDLLPESVRNFLPNGGRPVPEVEQPAPQEPGNGFSQPGQSVGGFQVAVDPYSNGGITYNNAPTAPQPQVPTQNFTAQRTNNGISVSSLGNQPQVNTTLAPVPAPVTNNQSQSASLSDGIGSMFGNWVNQVSGGILGQASGSGQSQASLPPYSPPIRQSSTQSFDGSSASASLLFQRTGGSANSLTTGRPVPPIAFDALPDDMSNSNPNNKQLFLSVMIPISLLVNEQIEAERQAILATGYNGQIQGGPMIVQQIANRYDVEGDVGTLLLHVDRLPVSLMLAQSIEESGWGTSRFAQEGNALFGQYTWNPNDPGLVPSGRPAGETYRIRAFPTLFDAMRSYALNLNRHDAYTDLRSARARARQSGRVPSGQELVQGLSQYTMDPGYYLPAIQGHINDSGLSRYDRLQLAQGPMLRVLGGTTSAGR